MHDQSLRRIQARDELRNLRIALTDPDLGQARSAILHSEHGPFRSPPEQRTQRRLHHAIGLPRCDTHEHAILVAEPAPRIVLEYRIEDHLDALLLDTEWRDLGERCGLETRRAAAGVEHDRQQEDNCDRELPGQPQFAMCPLVATIAGVPSDTTICSSSGPLVRQQRGPRLDC